MEQGREVPSHVAEGFLQGVDQDPKFLRFHERLVCVAQVQRVRETQKAAVEDLRAERRDLLVPDPRAVGLGLLMSLPLLGIAVALPLWQARAALFVFVFVALVLDETRARRARHARDVRLAKIDDEVTTVKENAEEAVRVLEARVAEIDAEAASTIRIIDPATFGAPSTTKKEEKRSS